MANYRNFSMQIGYLGGDPESRSAGDSKVITFDVATSKRWNDKKTGERKESTFWRRYEAWDKVGENIQARMKKGDLIQVVAEPSNNDYEKDGVKQYTERHTVLDWFDLSGKSKDDQNGGNDNSDDTPN